jgi:hypothetical protein
MVTFSIQASLSAPARRGAETNIPLSLCCEPRRTGSITARQRDGSMPRVKMQYIHPETGILPFQPLPLSCSCSRRFSRSVPSLNRLLRCIAASKEKVEAVLAKRHWSGVPDDIFVVPSWSLRFPTKRPAKPCFSAFRIDPPNKRWGCGAKAGKARASSRRERRRSDEARSAFPASHYPLFEKLTLSLSRSTERTL